MGNQSRWRIIQRNSLLELDEYSHSRNCYRHKVLRSWNASWVHDLRTPSEPRSIDFPLVRTSRWPSTNVDTVVRLHPIKDD